MSNTEVVVHINESLNKGKRDNLSKNICSLKGVETARLGDKRTQHLMIVAYNPEITKSMDVIAGVRSSGVHAQLVGWL